jgi:hypothetical protein
MSDLRQLIAKMDQIESGSMPKKKTIKEDATASRSMSGDIIGGIKKAGSAVSKVGGKALPAVGAAMSADSAHDRLKQGDYAGSAIDAVAAGASLYPPAWPVALGASGVNMLRDKAKEVGGWGNLAKEIGQSMKDHDDNNFLPENVDTLDEAGFARWLEESGLHTLDEGLLDLVKAGASKVGPAIKSGIGKLKDLVKPAEKEIADAPPISKFNQPSSGTVDLGGKGNLSKDKRWAYRSDEPGTMNVKPHAGEPPIMDPAAPVEKPAVFRGRDNPKFDPTLSKTDAQRQAALKDVEARMDALQAQQGKPRVNAKDYEAQLAKQRELEKQISGDPRPAVWKDPRNPNAPASKNPPPANVAPPEPMYPPALKGKSFRDASAEVNNGTSALSQVGDTVKRQAMPWRGEAPPESIYGPGGIKNFRQDAPLNPDYIKYPPRSTSAEKDAMFARAQSEYEKQMGWQPGFIPTTAAAAAAAAAKYGPDFVKSYVDTPGQKYMWQGPAEVFSRSDKDQPTATKEQPPADDASKDQTKESLQNKLFKEFKTFVEKR